MCKIKDYMLEHPEETIGRSSEKELEEIRKVFHTKEEVKIPKIEMLEPGWSGRVIKNIVGF